MFRFYLPWFCLLLPLPFVVRYFFPYKKTTPIVPPADLYFPRTQSLKQAFYGHHKAITGPARSFFFLLYAAWFFLILTIMQPEKVDQVTQVRHHGYDLMLAVDISASMQALDFSTNVKTASRLDVTKEIVGKFVLGRQGDRVGLVTFGQQAYLQVPLTLDTVSVSRMLDDTVSGMAGNATAIGDAIGLSVRSLRSRPEGSRVLILLTDGDDNASSIPPLEAAKLAAQYGIRIYTIGVGRNGPVPFPTKFGGYGMVEVTMDEALLKEIASRTGGRYFLASDQKALEAVYEQIDRLEKTESDPTPFFIRHPLYRIPLGIAMAFLMGLVVYAGFQRKIEYGF